MDAARPPVWGSPSALAVGASLSTPATAGLLGGGPVTPETLLGAFALILALVVVWYGVRAPGESGDDGNWNVSPPEHTRDTTVEQRGDASNGRDESAAETAEQYQAPSLSGHGGRSVDLERDPPEADLRAHLDHLETELDADDHRVELETMADVAAAHDDQRLPAECPHEHCDTPWRGRGIIRDASRNYERLGDGETVLCLGCERTVTLADPATD